MFVRTYNLVRMVMLEALLGQNQPVDRICFVDVLRWLGRAWRASAETRAEFLSANPIGATCGDASGETIQAHE